MRKLLAVALVPVLMTCAAWVAAFLQRPSPVPDDMAIEEIATAAHAELKSNYPESESGTVLRAAHAKGHGCVKAIFRTDPELPQDLRVGSFASPGQARKALIRYSNGTKLVQPDGTPDGRGMAIKLIDADPNKAGAASGRPPHDIILINFSRFFISGIGDYLSFVRVHGLRGSDEDLKAYFQPGWNPFGWRLSDAKIAITHATRPIESLLHTDYSSMTPYALGAGRAIKYAARPCATSANAPVLPHDSDYLRRGLVSELAAAPACFELLVQEQPQTVDLNDPRQEWQSPLRRIGQIDIPAQKVDAPEREAACENLSFNPSRAPPEHAPVGGINRIRAAVYERTANYRLKRNNTTPTDPERAWDSF